jgi:hypothetical protein
VPTQTVSTGVGDNSTGKDTMSYTLNYSNGPVNASVSLTDAAGGTEPYQITTIVANYDLGVAKIGVAQQSIRLDTGTNPGNGTSPYASVNAPSVSSSIFLHRLSNSTGFPLA